MTLLGEALRLQMSQGSPSAERRGDTLHLTLPDPEDSSAAERLMESYLDRLAKERVTQIMAEQYTQLRQGFDVAMPRLRIREMRTRWGSCLPQKGVVTLNRQLIFQPLCCVEYVALHELCHLVVPNHSCATWRAGCRTGGSVGHASAGGRRGRRPGPPLRSPKRGRLAAP